MPAGVHGAGPGRRLTDRVVTMRITSFAHTGDVGFALEAQTLSELFDAAREALLAVLLASPPASGSEERTVRLSAPSLEVLLVRWLDEILYLAQTEGCLAAASTPTVAARGDGWDLSATVAVEPYRPATAGALREVKAVTYHGLAVHHAAEGWRARVILDV